jgi:A/G-specific adenine glycosylase
MRTIASAEDVSRRITGWYTRAARVLPWRSDPSPYHVLLSELMLQQTRVETVIPYFERFRARWPTLQALADADEDEVLREWAGLGYYSRARNLHRCAVAAAAMGGLPSHPAELQALPGIGPYTAGAIASIAFGARAPLVDGNVERVLCRLDARTEDPRREGRAGLWDRARALVEAAPELHPGAVNQALMELGAVVCTPKSPRCGACPVAELCLGQADAESLPRKAARTKPAEVRAVAVVATWEGRVVFGRRPPGLLGGLWEPIRVPLEPGQPELARLRAGFLAETGAELLGAAPLGEVVHVFTHRRLTCAVYEGRASREPALGPDAEYTALSTPADPESLGLSALARRVLAMTSAPRLPLAAEPR